MFSVLQNEGHTPLHISAWEGDESMIKYLQSCKANPNIIDKVIAKKALTLNFATDFLFMRLTDKQVNVVS